MFHDINATYGAAARFDNVDILSDDQLRTMVPSVFNYDPSTDRSSRFEVIPTIEVVKALQKEGFGVVGATQSTSRDGDVNNVKHLLRLRKMDGKTYNVGDSVYEMLLKNANNGTSAYEIMGGIYRVRCANSLVSCIADMETVKVYHSGKNVIDNVIEGTYSVLEEANRVLEAPDRWSGITLNQDQVECFAEAVHYVRFGDTEGKPHPIEPMQLVRPRREGDVNRDLWTLFNVAQENSIRGGIVGRGTHNITTRPINAIDRSVNVNRDLWKLGAAMAELV